MSENEKKVNWMKEAINLKIKRKRYNELCQFGLASSDTKSLNNLNWENVMIINRKERSLIFL